MRDRQDVSAAPASLHVDRTGHLVLPLPVREAFPFFTPEGERRWVPGWAPEYLHPAEPSAEPGTVFRTQVDGEETLWIVLQFFNGVGSIADVRIGDDSGHGMISAK